MASKKVLAPPELQENTDALKLYQEVGLDYVRTLQPKPIRRT